MSHIELVWASLRRRPMHALLALICATLVSSLYGLGFGLAEALRRAPSLAPAELSQQIQSIATAISVAGIGLILVLTVAATGQAVRLRSPEFGILKALGFSQRRIAALVIAESAAPCVAGAVLGLALAPALLATLKLLLPSLAQLPQPVYSIAMVAAGLAVALFAPALGSLIPVWKAVRLPAFAAMTGRVEISPPVLGRERAPARVNAETPTGPARSTMSFDRRAEATLLRQVAVAGRIGLSTVKSRLKGAMLIVGGVALLSFVLLYVLAMAEGIRTSILASGDPARVLLRPQSSAWLQDGSLPDGIARIAAEAPGVARGVDGSVLAEPLHHAVMGLDPRDGSRRRPVMLMGIGPHWREMTPTFQLLSGRWPHPGSKELLAGFKARETFSDLDDDRVTFRGEQWKVVGTFSTGDWWNGYMLGDYAEVRAHDRRSADTAILVRLQSTGSFGEFQKSVASRLPPSIKVEREPDYYKAYWNSLPKNLVYVVYLLSVIIAMGVITGITHVVHAALEERRREIAILRVVGFDGRAIAASAVIESLLLAVLGSFIGSAMVWLSVDGAYHHGAWSAWQSTVSGHLVLVAMGWASVVALLGTIPMAVQTLRKSEREALADLRLSDHSASPNPSPAPRDWPCIAAVCRRC